MSFIFNIKYSKSALENTVSNLGFEICTISVTTIQLCLCNMKVAIDHRKISRPEYVQILIKLYLQRSAVSWIRPMVLN